jgi:hypothetical protein
VCLREGKINPLSPQNRVGKCLQHRHRK